MKSRKSIGSIRRTYRLIRGQLKLIVYWMLCKLLRRKWSAFDDEIYRGKRVIVVGPAASSLSYLPGEDIDKFDFVVRINKSPAALAGKESLLGSRTDILYHCCNEDPVHGGGVIDPNLLAAQGVRKIVYTYAEQDFEHRFFRCLIRYPSLQFCRTQSSKYWKLKRAYGRGIPTTGLQALYHLLSSPCEELHITGFTFFRTAYTPNYRSGFETAEEGRRLAESAGNHNAERELLCFVAACARVKNKTVYLDSELDAICKSVDRQDVPRFV